MQLREKVAVVTGAGRGIGAALAVRFAAEGAAGVVVSDRDVEAAAAVAQQIITAGGHALAVRADVTDDHDVQELVRITQEQVGPIDLFCSNAGVTGGAGLWADDGAWAQTWDVNVMGHVRAARAVLPSMIRRRSGYLLSTVSAVGLMTLPGDAPYSATKHAALGLAEWLACTYSPRGVRVSALCPWGVWTDMLRGGIEADHLSAMTIAAVGTIMSPEAVADAAIRGIAEERFLILPEPSVQAAQLRKAQDRDAWIAETAAQTRLVRRNSRAARVAAEAGVAGVAETAEAAGTGAVSGG